MRRQVMTMAPTACMPTLRTMPSTKNFSAGSIVYAGDQSGNYDLYSIRTDGSDRRQLTTSPRDDIHPSISPDGAVVAFASLRILQARSECCRNAVRPASVPPALASLLCGR